MTDHRPLAILAVDHRGSFRRLHARSVPGWDDLDAVAQHDAMRASKLLVLEAFESSRREGVAAAILVDEQFGAEVAARAAQQDTPVAMPVEKSGQEVFDFEYGEDFGTHLLEHRASYAKVLVRHNPQGDGEANAVQRERLAILSDWCAVHQPDLLLELLVPPTDDQLESARGDRDVYDADVRPELVRRAMADLQDGGIRPDLWKLEGLESSDDARAIAEQAHAVERPADCVVLGRGADRERVDHWLRVAAPVDGFVGFAIGRSIFAEDLAAQLAGDLDRDEVIDRIAGHYDAFSATYLAAADD